MAKGVEDTAFYVTTASSPSTRWAATPTLRHLARRVPRPNAEPPQRWPHALNATATHDTKRGEDVRARMT